jgi:sugar phosphate isomerase/epimerase
MKGKIMPIGVVISGADPLASLEKVASFGMSTCQMSVPPGEWWSKERIELIRRTAEEKEIKITSLICGFKGESYRDIPTIKRTVGLLNPATRGKRVLKVLSYSDFALELEVEIIQAHIGFIPEDTSDPDYKRLVLALQKIADYCKENNQSFTLETGQEKALVLSKFIEDVNRLNLGVNFDPANMLVYDADDPIKALDILGKYVIGVHCKDGKRPERKGELGKEYPLGEGDVGIEKFIDKLRKIGYAGHLTIEREISGEKQIRDILKAKGLLQKLVNKE